MPEASGVTFVGGLQTTRAGPAGGARTLFDPAATVTSAQVLEAIGFDQAILVYSSYSLDPFAIAATVASHTERLGLVIALRPNTAAPTAAAKSYATIDQLSAGRTQVHLIAGGNESDQWRDGDFIDKDARYRRMGEYIDILRRAWSSETSFDHEGEFYRIVDYTPKVKPFAGVPLPISLGGSSEAAYRVGAERADVFALWGEPLADTRGQLDRVRALATEAGTAGPEAYMISFKPVIAPSDELAWAKADALLERLTAHRARARPRGEIARHVGLPGAEASKRILRIAERGTVHDTALWTEPARATGAIGSSAALVGGYDTVASAVAAYADLGIRRFSFSAYGGLDDYIEKGTQLFPRIRALLDGHGA